MAEGSSVNQDSVVCRYFLSGECRDGISCNFSHDSTRHVPDNVCRYYLQGKCIFGFNCRFDHVHLNKKSSPETESSNEKLSAGPSRCSSSLSFTDWINAPIFVPRKYAEVVRPMSASNSELPLSPSDELCPLFAEGNCPVSNCPLIHGNICKLCEKAYLHPFNKNARMSHIEKCEKELVDNMCFTFGKQRSSDKTCGICMDIVLKKEPVTERRFGLLENCNHVYCLSCIRKWRSTGRNESHQTDNFLKLTSIRACPECRIPSDFVIPSVYFIDTEQEKLNLIAQYKEALSRKRCKYFKEGQGNCPFGRNCFYLHATPDGTKIDLPAPVRRYRQNEAGHFEHVEQIHLWNYLEHREINTISPFEKDDDSLTSD